MEERREEERPAGNRDATSLRLKGFHLFHLDALAESVEKWRDGKAWDGEMGTYLDLYGFSFDSELTWRDLTDCLKTKHLLHVLGSECQRVSFTACFCEYANPCLRIMKVLDNSSKWSVLFYFVGVLSSSKDMISPFQPPSDSVLLSPLLSSAPSSLWLWLPLLLIFPLALCHVFKLGFLSEHLSDLQPWQQRGEPSAAWGKHSACSFTMEIGFDPPAGPPA